MDQSRQNQENIPCYGFPARRSRQNATKEQKGKEGISGPRIPVGTGAKSTSAQLRERPLCHSDKQEACPLSRLAERAETRPEGGVPAGNEAVRGAGPSAQERTCRERSSSRIREIKKSGRAASVVEVVVGGSWWKRGEVVVVVVEREFVFA